ncbi:hypothetical protein HC766_01720 [Candidatus Gracilibacteria bacterium]|nr:hypothetical protein [Candidatus Gracilibacteria bacterium]NJS41089.1 hypothetical protein [Candidatus Gracilibacteria bacterium]
MNPIEIFRTNFEFPNQTRFYRGKVRDVYVIKDKYLVLVNTDRISAFDQVFWQTIKYKGCILNQISNFFFEYTSNLHQNWAITSPHPCVTIGHYYARLPYEFIVRQHLDGWVWKEYHRGIRRFWNVILPNNLERFSALPKLIFSITTKSQSGKDIPVSYNKVFSEAYLNRNELYQIREICFDLFQKASNFYSQKNLILADTKLELSKDKVILDEIFTPDCSRLYNATNYNQRLQKRQEVENFSKEVFRKILLDSGFDPVELVNKENPLPSISISQRQLISQKYSHVYKSVFDKDISQNNPQMFSSSILQDIYQSTCEALKNL